MLIRINSHRAGRKMQGVLKHAKPVWRYTFEHGGIYAEIDDRDADAARRITGITRARVKLEDTGKCWS